MTSQTPKVSIITPVFNAARFLPRLFESVKHQYGFEYEHILVDDCSSDASLRIMRAYAEGNNHTVVIALSENKGPVIARNLAISAARGKYLAFLDADDYWLPNKLFVQTQLMEQTGAAISFTDYRFISEDGAFIGRRLRGPDRVGWSLHHMTRYLGCLTIMINKECCPYFYFPDISPSIRAEDFLAWAKVIQLEGPALRCEHDLARYSVVSNSRSSGALKASKSVWLLYRKVEHLSLIRSTIYFAIYAIFTAYKRAWFNPRWKAAHIDRQEANAYLLTDMSK
jgi:teichuronic acid biosynthesis glycosyltransferase TuaG